MQYVRRLLISVVVLAVLLAGAALAQAQSGTGQVKHTVQAGETLYRIALKYGKTVDAVAQANNITNPNLIYVGQELTIPGATTATATPVPTGTQVGVTPVPVTATATPVPTGGETIHIVQPGENLFRIALQYNLSASYVAAYNGIPNPNIIYVGQRIRIPAGAATSGQVPLPLPAQTTQTPAPTAAISVTLPANQAANVGFAYGIAVHLPNQDMAAVLTAATGLGVTWIQQEIDWALYEPSQGNINWAPIDEMVDAMDSAGLNILLTVASAPGWARDSNQESGPPADYQTYAAFIGQVAERYEGQVDAYEVWTEPNLRQEWNTSKGISAASYVELLRLAYTAIKTVDPKAIVVSAGLAPTGVNDGTAAIDDRVYLRQMYAAGVGEWSDAIGAHPSGWANPPDSTCCRNNRPEVPAYDDHPSFFFKETLQDYREIMVQNGDSGTYIWPTEFGWGSNDGLNVEPGIDFSEDFAFVAYTNLDEQAQYDTRAFQLGREWGYIGPMFLWNLNLCQVVGVTGEQCMWSLLDPAGNPRPAYLAVKNMAK
jgi:LysM repeat protein